MESDQRSSPRMSFRRAEFIQPSKPEWLWVNWLCIGALHLIVGRQGSGKTTFVSWVLGMLSRGSCLPGDSTPQGPVTTAILSLEEPADRLVARLHAAGADLSRVLVLDDVEDFDEDGNSFHRPWRMPQDCHVLENVLTEQKIEAVAIDGLGYSVAGDSHNYGNIGSALSALAGAAERSGCAVIGLTHPPKGGSDPVTSAIGSTAWTAVARIVWVLGVDPNDETGGHRVAQIGKSNFKMPPAGVGFSIGDAERWECGYVTGVDTSSVTAEDLMAASAPPGERTEREEAREFVRVLLKDGPMETVEVMKQTRAAGISDRTVERARQDLKVKAKAKNHPETGKRVGWVLELPEPVRQSSPPVPLLDGVGGVGGVVVTSSFSPSFSNQSAQSAQSGSEAVWFQAWDGAPPPDDSLFMNDDVSTRRCAQSREQGKHL